MTAIARYTATSACTSYHGFEPMTWDDVTALSANRQKFPKKKGTMKFCEGERKNSAKTKTNLLPKKGPMNFSKVLARLNKYDFKLSNIKVY